MSIDVLKDRAREEVIQVAAVATAILEYLDYGSCSLDTIDEALVYVRKERLRQEEKWGPQSCDLDRWATILGEEFGEFCQASLEYLWKVEEQ